ncbi:MAG: hypothetical protein ACLQI7_26625, partial [Streptosporangiaceae bacterium]
MQSAKRAWWQQATAVVSLGAGGAVTGVSFAPRAAADIKLPSSTTIRLLALRQSVQAEPAASDATRRSAIVNVARYYLRMAKTKDPAEMEALIWEHDSIDGVDHGESCAAFASLTLELAAQAVGQQSWVTGGTSYPWPLHKWADVRVDPNPASPGITSVLQDAQAHHRWHPLGDGYRPRPGDWVLFDGHVEVVTRYAGGVLSTIGGDSLPNLSVNAHEYPGPLSAEGVAGFVNNGELSDSQGTSAGGHSTSAAAGAAAAQRAAGTAAARQAAGPSQTAIPGAPASAPATLTGAQHSGDTAIPGVPVPVPEPRRPEHMRPPQAGPRQARRGASHDIRRPDQAHRGSSLTPAVPGTSSTSA